MNNNRQSQSRMVWARLGAARGAVLVIIATIVVSLFGGGAKATPYAWTLSGGPNNDLASGTLDTGSAAGAGFNILDLSGTITADNGLYSGSVTLLGGDPGIAGSKIFPNKVAYDNVAFPSLPNQLLDGNGLLLSLTGGSLIIGIEQRGPAQYALYIGDSAGAGTDLYNVNGLSFTMTEVPEPAGISWMAAGLVALVARGPWRRRTGGRLGIPAV